MSQAAETMSNNPAPVASNMSPWVRRRKMPGCGRRMAAHWRPLEPGAGRGTHAHTRTIAHSRMPLRIASPGSSAAAALRDSDLHQPHMPTNERSLKERGPFGCIASSN
ncbi:hypothetical protein B0H11DRAFT_2224898 [Mycena galericulata]|nr:hypothetical protein B0H11DRAFT_2224898 [Mycena galericulata]